ncbi:MAG: Holliday junction branch migration protein RuvA [bacterium]|nr:Holliday junction branch migration protein RuvA [bacterium]
MISHLSGKVLMRGDRFVALDVSGVGYKIFVMPEALKEARKNPDGLSLWTHLHVRENALELYGFMEYAELEFFEMLIQISGIGPKSGLGVLAVAPLDTLKRAISAGDTSYLTKVSGIGRKIAEKIVLELRDKMGGLDLGETGNAMLKEEGDVLEALQSLGYSLSEAREALKKIPLEIKGANARIKAALKEIGR